MKTQSLMLGFSLCWLCSSEGRSGNFLLRKPTSVCGYGKGLRSRFPYLVLVQSFANSDPFRALQACLKVSRSTPSCR